MPSDTNIELVPTATEVVASSSAAIADDIPVDLPDVVGLETIQKLSGWVQLPYAKLAVIILFLNDLGLLSFRHVYSL